MLIADVIVSAFPAALSSSRVLVMLLALAVLIGVGIVATHRYWRLWRPTAKESPRAETLRERDEHLKLALWASGEHFWDYDLVRRRLHRMRADENAAHSAEI